LWTSNNTDVVLNGTNLLNSHFNLSSISVNVNVSITGSSIYIKNNLYIKKNSVLTLENSAISVDGDFYVDNESTIILNETDNITFINVKHCAFLSGKLVIVTSYNEHLGKRLPILNSSCINGTFSSIIFNLTDRLQCNILPQLEYQQSSLIMVFDITDQCTSEGIPWIYIAIGVVGFLFLSSIIIAAFFLFRKTKKRMKKLEKLKAKSKTIDE